MLQRLPIALAQVKAGNNSQSLLNEIRQFVYSFYQSKEITKKVYNNKIKSNTIIKMDAIFMNPEKSKTSKSHVLILQLNDKSDLRRGEKSVALSNGSIYYTWKNIKSSYKNNLKYQLQHGMINLNYQVDHILCQIFKIILSIFLKNNKSIDSLPIRIYVNKIGNRITFKI